MHARKKELLGTVIEIKCPDPSFFSSCFDEIARIEKTYSRFKDSELTKVNARLGEWQPVSKEFIALLRQGLDLYKKSDGFFDMTLKETLDDLGYDANYTMQSKNRMHQRVQDAILIRGGEVLLKKQVEFGGFGKGYAADQVAKVLDGFDSFCINAGGDIYAKGDWEIALEHPDDAKRVIGKVVLNGNAIACSTPNRRRWGEHHHLINPKSDKPENSIKAVWVRAKCCIDADACATALFAAGFENAMSLYKKLGVEVLIISSKNKMFRSPGFEVEFFS